MRADTLRLEKIADLPLACANCAVEEGETEIPADCDVCDLKPQKGYAAVIVNNVSQCLKPEEFRQYASECVWEFDQIAAARHLTDEEVEGIVDGTHLIEIHVVKKAAE